MLSERLEHGASHGQARLRHMARTYIARSRLTAPSLHAVGRPDDSSVLYSSGKTGGRGWEGKTMLGRAHNWRSGVWWCCERERGQTMAGEGSEEDGK